MDTLNLLETLSKTFGFSIEQIDSKIKFFFFVSIITYPVFEFLATALYRKKIKFSLVQARKWVKKRSYISLIHSDTGRAKAYLDKVFTFKRVVLIASLSSLLTVLGILIVEYFSSYEDLTSLEKVQSILNEEFSSGVIVGYVTTLFIFLLLNVISDYLSKHFTIFALTNCKPKIGSLFKWLSVDIGIFLYFSYAVLAIAESLQFQITSFIDENLTWLEYNNVVFFILILDSLRLSTEDPTNILGLILSLSVSISSGLPTFIHMGLILFDLFLKVFGKPLMVMVYLFLNGLSRHKEPIRVLFYIVGFSPVVINILIILFQKAFFPG